MNQEVASINPLAVRVLSNIAASEKEIVMNTKVSARKSKPYRTTVDDISAEGMALSEDQLQLVSGGLPSSGGWCGSYQPASCTYNNDTDYYKD
jgi:hypothetical protein